MGATWAGRWEGGRIRVTEGGKRVFMIERSIAGRRYAISLEVATETDARAELALFLRNPVAYAAALSGGPAPAGDPLYLDDALVDRFIAWARELESKGELSHDYVEHILDAYLRQWAKKLAGVDLRRATTVQLRQVLGGWTKAKKHRVIALKALTAWLRKNGFLTSQTDPTLDLKTIRGKRKRTEEEAKAYPLEDVQVVYRATFYQAIRDRIVLCFRHGAHLSELERFARGIGRLRAVGPWEGCPIVGTLRLKHKSGEWHTISLDAQSFAAAQRIAADGHRSRSWCYKHLADTARTHNVPLLHLGSGRHSFVTWCRTPGLGVTKHEPPAPAISLEDVAAVTGHRTLATPRFHYDEADHIPHLLLVPVRLVHPDDPPVDQVERLGTAVRRA